MREKKAPRGQDLTRGQRAPFKLGLLQRSSKAQGARLSLFRWGHRLVPSLAARSPGTGIVAGADARRAVRAESPPRIENSFQVAGHFLDMGNRE